MYKILICKPGGRYGQIAHQFYLKDENNKDVKYQDKAGAENRVRIMMEAPSYLRLPVAYRPEYKVVK